MRQLGYTVIEVQFGASSPDLAYANMRAYMWGKMRDWLRNGGAIDDSAVLEQDLTAPEYAHNKKDQLLLEPKEAMKKRGLASPDDGDALAMTFAYPVALTAGPGHDSRGTGKAASDWDPYADNR